MQITDGSDVTIMATGHMLSKALRAAEELKKEGIAARVVNIHTIKPIDVEGIKKCAAETGAIVTVEEHNVYGGLGAAVAEVVAAHCPVPLEMAGIGDVFAESGDYEKLLEKYGLSARHIATKARSVLKRKK